MKLRRCPVVWLEPKEVAVFSLDALLQGGSGILSRLAWYAHAPHLGHAVEIEAAALPVLGALGAVDWIDGTSVEARFGAGIIDGLIRQGLLVVHADGGHALPDDAYRGVGWHAAAAVAHIASRWEGMDGVRAMAEAGVDTSAGLVREQGLPPPHVRPVQDATASLALPVSTGDDFDDLLDARVTCRNFDSQARLPLAAFSQLMARVFGARGRARPVQGFEVIKRTSPSGGSLHPTECWLIVQRVEGVAPGLYRYQVDAHALEPVTPRIRPPRAHESITHVINDTAAATQWDAEALHAFARIAMAGQEFFADAPVQCILAPRFHRSYWKYRNHAKAYRVATLDVGHLSQTLQLSATQAGLGPFVTAAINEVDIERAFGLTSYLESPLLVCGFGKRAARLAKSEFDPNRRHWNANATSAADA